MRWLKREVLVYIWSTNPWSLWLFDRQKFDQWDDESRSLHKGVRHSGEVYGSLETFVDKCGCNSQHLRENHQRHRWMCNRPKQFEGESIIILREWRNRMRRFSEEPCLPIFVTETTLLMVPRHLGSSVTCFLCQSNATNSVAPSVMLLFIFVLNQAKLNY